MDINWYSVLGGLSFGFVASYCCDVFLQAFNRRFRNRTRELHRNQMRELQAFAEVCEKHHRERIHLLSLVNEFEVKRHRSFCCYYRICLLSLKDPILSRQEILKEFDDLRRSNKDIYEACRAMKVHIKMHPHLDSARGDVMSLRKRVSRIVFSMERQVEKSLKYSESN